VAKVWALFLAAFIAACSGGSGGGTTPFELSGSSPTAGDAEAPIDASLLVVFNRPADVDTITRENIRLEQADGTPVAINLFVQGFNASAINLEPLKNLEQNVVHRIILTDGVLAADGTPLAAKTVCFVTASFRPTVRPDQLLDLGDILQEPRYLARSVRLPNGTSLIVGGYKNETDATDTLEIYEPDTRSFRLVSGRLSVPRAEHHATLLTDGRVVISGGVSEVGGVPLASTDIFNFANETVQAGPRMHEARRYHASSTFNGGSNALVSGGFDENGDELDSVELFNGASWILLADRLPVASARGFQINYDFDKVYFSASNLDGVSALYNGTAIVQRVEGDIRFRSSYLSLGGGKFMIVGGDTRSFATYSFSTNFPWSASEFLRERRGAHSLTVRGLGGRRFLIAGGFNIAAPGHPPLRTLEVFDSVDPGPHGFPDVVGGRVDNVLLPIPFAGHVGFNEPDGPSVLAGGVGDGSGPHSRRVVLVLDNISAPKVVCPE
jgi:hypothetical protein